MTAGRDERTGLPAEGEVLVLIASLDAHEAELEAARATLTDEERARADRRVTAELTRRAVLSRAHLRAALGRALGRSPGDVSLAVGAHGRPEFGDPADAARIDFNVSHTEDIWVVALARRGPIGIDIEAPRPSTERDALAERWFSAAEHAAFRALPAERREEAFFRTWTQKEAFLKARGSGLATPLAAFDVEVDPARPTGLLGSRIEGVVAGEWWILAIDGLGFPSAVAGTGRPPAITVRGAPRP